jgi:hypothetical protein
MFLRQKSCRMCSDSDARGLNEEVPARCSLKSVRGSAKCWINREWLRLMGTLNLGCHVRGSVARQAQLCVEDTMKGWREREILNKNRNIKSIKKVDAADRWIEARKVVHKSIFIFGAEGATDSLPCSRSGSSSSILAAGRLLFTEPNHHAYALAISVAERSPPWLKFNDMYRNNGHPVLILPAEQITSNYVYIILILEP